MPPPPANGISIEPVPFAANGLAAAYQPRRLFAAGISIAWNLTLALLFTACHGARRLYESLESLLAAHHHLSRHHWIAPLDLAVCFIAYAVWNYPIEFYIGYLEERQFGLAKDGVRAWTRDWLIANLQHGVMFCIGAILLLALQTFSPARWFLWCTAGMLALFLATTCFALSLIPGGMFQFEPIDQKTRSRLENLVAPLHLPRVLSYSAPQLREFAGGLIGLGFRQVWLVSHTTLHAASDALLRFVLIHDLGHRRYRHLLLSTLAGWAWAVIGLCVSHAFIMRFAPDTFGLPPYIAWLAMCFSMWMAIGEPLLAYLGRRLEYQADRFYLRHGGNIAEMTAALEELSRRNLARTDDLRRRQTIFHPLPSVRNRIYAASVFMQKSEES